MNQNSAQDTSQVSNHIDTQAHDATIKIQPEAIQTPPKQASEVTPQGGAILHANPEQSSPQKPLKEKNDTQTSNQQTLVVKQQETVGGNEQDAQKKKEQPLTLNPKMFSAPKSIKDKIDNRIDALNKQIINARKARNLAAANGEDYTAQTQQLLTLNNDLDTAHQEFRAMIQSLFKNLIASEKYFVRFSQSFLKNIPKLFEVISQEAKVVGFKELRTGPNGCDIVVYKQEDTENNFRINVDRSHPRQQLNNNPTVEQKQQQETVKIETQRIAQNTQYFTVPPDPITEYFIYRGEGQSLRIRFDAPDDNGSAIDKYRVSEIDKEYMIHPNHKEIRQFYQEGHALEITLTYGQELRYNDLLLISINAHNEHGWSRETETSYFRLYLKQVEPASLFIKGSIETDLVPLLDNQETLPFYVDEKLVQETQILPDFQLFNLEMDKVRQFSGKYSAKSIVNDQFMACQWGQTLQFEEEGKVCSFELNKQKDFAFTVPYQISSNRAITKVSCGSSHSLALSIDGSVFAWGSNKRGQLGIGTTESHMNLQEVRYFTGQKIFIVDIQAGNGISMVLSSNCTPYVWGSRMNEFGGALIPILNRFEEIVNMQCLDKSNIQLLPRKINLKCKAVSMTYSAFVALDLDDNLYMWGSNKLGAFGFRVQEQLDQEIFHLVQPMLICSNVQSFSCGAYHVIVKQSNKLISWGLNDQGQCGHLNCQLQTQKQIDIVDVKAFSCGYNHSLFLLDKQRLLGCGGNQMMQLINNNTLFYDHLVEIPLGFIEVSQLHAGFYTTVVLGKD